jgi:ribosomal protein S18 acetylase RimI-like enzyme
MIGEPPDIEYRRHGGEQSADLVEQLAPVFAEVYAEAPYHFGSDEVTLFRERFDVQHKQDGFSLVTAHSQSTLVGFVFGVTLLPTTAWWTRLLTPVTEEMSEERPGRTFAIVELVVRRPWRRRGVARRMHDMLLSDRPEERATLTARPDASPAQTAYARWGWRKVAEKTNPLPGNPVYDILIKPLTGDGDEVANAPA